MSKALLLYNKPFLQFSFHLTWQVLNQIIVAKPVTAVNL